MMVKTVESSAFFFGLESAWSGPDPMTVRRETITATPTFLLNIDLYLSLCEHGKVMLNKLENCGSK
jgi:hypothetical protein